MNKKSLIKHISFILSLSLFIQTIILPSKAFASQTTLLPPSNLSYQLLTPDDIKLTWNHVIESSKYNIYQIINGQIILIGSSNANYYQISNLEEGTYQYVVSSATILEESGPSAPVTIDIKYPNMTIPSTLNYSIRNGNDIVLSWTSSPYTDFYKLYKIDSDNQKQLVTQVTGTSYTISQALEGNHKYAVSAVNEKYGESSISDIVSIDLVYPVISAPSSFTYSVNNGNNVTLRWQTVAYATNYRIYQIIDGNKVLKNTVSGSYVNLTDMPFADYSYEIYTYSDRFGESKTGTRLDFTLEEVIIIPPSNVTYSVRNINDILINWDASSYANKYFIYEIINGEKIFQKETTSRSLTLYKVPFGEHVYEIHAYSSTYGESEKGNQFVVNVESVVMQPPKELTYTIQNGNDILLSWTNAENANSYNIYQIINGEKILKNNISRNVIKYSFMPEGDYSFIVHSVSDRIGESSEGTQINFSLKYPTILPPTNVSYNIVRGTDVSLKWDASDYTTNYYVYEVINGEKVLKYSTKGTIVTLSKMEFGEHTLLIHAYSDRFGESKEGSMIKVNIEKYIMQPPTDLNYSINNGNDIILTFTASENANSYNVYQIINGEKTLLENSTNTRITLTNMKQADYKLAVYSESIYYGESLTGTEIPISLVYPTILPPENVTYNIRNGDDIYLSWDKADYASNYVIYEVVNNEKNLIKSVNYTTYPINNVSAGEHRYLIYTNSSRFGESLVGSQVDITLDIPTIQNPSNLKYSITLGNDVLLEWDAVEYANNYNIYQLIDGEKVLKSTSSRNLIKYTNMPEGSYTFIIHGNNTLFGESEEGTEVSFDIVFPIMQPPSELTYSINNGNDIILKWNSAEYATGYKVYEIIDDVKTLCATVAGNSYVFKNKSEGEHKFEISSYSTRFLESKETADVNIQLDFPTIEAPVLNGQIYDVNNITLSWKTVEWADEYRIYEMINGENKLLFNGKAISYKVSNLTEGEHTFCITANSFRFGESKLSNMVTETIIYPEMQSPELTGKVTNDSEAVLQWDFITYANGYNIYELIEGQAELTAFNVNNLSYILKELTPEKHEYYITSYSKSFGESKPSNIVEIQIINDDQPPVTKANAPNEWVNDNEVVVALTAIDDNSGVKATYYAVDNNEYQIGTEFSIEKEGIHKIRYYSVDNEGNTEEVNTQEIKIDKTAPVTTINEVPKSSSEPITIQFSAVDTYSDVRGTYYSINNGEYFNSNVLKIEDEGLYEIVYYSIDYAGNKEVQQMITVSIDKTAPVIKLESEEDEKSYTPSDSLELNYSIEDNISNNLKETIIITYPDGKTEDITDKLDDFKFDKPGEYTIDIKVTDEAGQTTTIQKQIQVSLPITIRVTPTVIKGNKGVFTVRAYLPQGYSTKGFNLDTVTLNGVNALTSNKGYYNQAKKGQFKFERSDFEWNAKEVTVKLEGYVDGILVYGETKVKVKK